ncbi:MAG: hypothetical protein AAB589_00180 [Patescibacteria group bacterium]
MKTALKISLPKETQAWVQNKVVSEDLKQHLHREIENSLLASLNSGKPVKMTKAWLKDRYRLLEKK